jgi:hypothetical protein
MGIPKRKTNVQIYKGTELTKRRQELLDKITKADSYLPESILHDDLDAGMLDYITNTFKVESEGKQIPIIKKILTIQRWAEFANNWEFSDQDGNMELPFIAVIRQPEANLGTNPSVQRTIPDRYQVYYASVPTWDGNQMGADIYTIPQPIPIDINYTVTIVCNKFRDVNKFNRKVLQHFASRQDYTTIKGHYIPLILDKIEDNTPMQTLEGRRFYLQNYSFTLLGYLMDSDEFEVKPSINRLFTMTEFLKDNKLKSKKTLNKDNVVQTATFIADGIQTQFSVGESIGVLFDVKQDNQLLNLNHDYFHVAYTPNINFDSPPAEGSIIVVQYYKGRNNRMLGSTGKLLQHIREEFQYTGTEPVDSDGNPIYSLTQVVSNIITVEINGLAEQENIGYELVDDYSIKLLGRPLINSNVSISYLY